MFSQGGENVLVEEYFGTKELYQVALKANAPMNFGFRKIEVGEPVLYFEKVNIALLSEESNPVMARGGWGNMPRVIWEDRSEVNFTLSEGVMSAVGMGILTSARLLEGGTKDVLYVQKKEGPFELDENNSYRLSYTPSLDKKIFVFSYDRNCIQEKKEFEIQGNKLIVKNGNPLEQYVIDYYFEYGEEALVYLIEKERFNGTFSLEAKFYTKDENDGLNSTNLLTMPKVRVMSNINLRLGERAEPTTSVFNIIALPEKGRMSKTLIMDIVRLGKDIDADI